MARPAAISLLWALGLILAACGEEGANLPVEVSGTPSLPRTASPSSPIIVIVPSETPKPSPEAAWLSAIPTEYVEAFHLAGAVYGWEHLIQRIRIPVLNLDSPVVPVGWRTGVDGVIEWDSPGPYVGWAMTSALPEGNGNIILYGHNNIEGGIFRHLYRLQEGDSILLLTDRGEWHYRVESVTILAVQEREDERRLYRLYLAESSSPRLTLLSCYPPENNTHRVLVIARPLEKQGGDSGGR